MLQLGHIGRCPSPKMHGNEYDCAHITDNSQLRKLLGSRRLPKVLNSAAAFDEVPTAVVGFNTSGIDGGQVYPTTSR